MSASISLIQSPLVQAAPLGLPIVGNRIQLAEAPRLVVSQPQQLVSPWAAPVVVGSQLGGQVLLLDSQKVEKVEKEAEDDKKEKQLPLALPASLAQPVPLAQPLSWGIAGAPVAVAPSRLVLSAPERQVVIAPQWGQQQVVLASPSRLAVAPQQVVQLIK